MADSYSYSVKTEICRRSETAENCCKASMLYGMLLMTASYGSAELRFTSGHGPSVRLLKTLAGEVAGIELPVCGGGSKLAVCADKAASQRLLEIMGHGYGEVSLRLNRAVLECESCAGAFLAGAFLSAGAISSPEKEYRLEIASPHIARTRGLESLIKELGYNPLCSKRGGATVLYFKDSGDIEELLALMGATNSALEIMNAKILKDLRNRANRYANCETANMERAVGAALEQAAAIELLIEKGMLEELDEKLKAVANLRLENKESSLSELAALSNPPMSRSAVNRRLEKLTELAKTVRGEKN